MSSLKTLREEINRVEVIHEVMGTLEKVAGFERVRSQNFYNKIKGYEEELAGYFKGILPVTIETEDPKGKKPFHPLLLCFGTEQGLTGSFAEEFAKYVLAEALRIKPVKIIATGHKLETAVREVPMAQKIEFLEMPRKHSSTDILTPVANRVMQGLSNNEFSQVYLVSAGYQTLGGYKFQTSHIFRLKPVLEGDPKHMGDYVFIEPSLARILHRYLMLTFAARLALPWREVRLVEASLRLLETNRAKENAGDTAKKLRLVYARTLRGKVTRSINELFTGKAAFERRKRKEKVFFEFKV